jgi:hypothetical protein
MRRALTTALVLLMVACQREAPLTKGEAMEAGTLVLTNGYGPQQVGTALELAAANFRTEPVQTPAGTSEQLTAMLFVLDKRSTPARQENVRVHRGQTVEVAGQKLEVVDVAKGQDGRPLVRLRVLTR